jgi:hypothetical protein
MYRGDDLRLVAADVGTQPQTSLEDIDALLTLPKGPGQHNPIARIIYANEPIARIVDTGSPKSVPSNDTDWLTPITSREETRRRRHIDVSQDPGYGMQTIAGDKEYIEAPTRIPDRVILLEFYELIFSTLAC